MREIEVSKAATSLQKRELISDRHDDNTVHNRSGLEAVPECCAVDKTIYARIMG